MESIFCLLLVVEAFSLQKVAKMFEEVVVRWGEVSTADEAKLYSPICSMFKCCLCNLWPGIVVKNWAFLLTTMAAGTVVFGASY